VSHKAIHEAALEAFRLRYAGSPVREPDIGSPARVARLDRSGAYLLVPVRDAMGLRAIVQLDADTLALEGFATVGDPTSGFLIGADEALEIAQRSRPQTSGWLEPFLGWRPCRESFDSMRPFWVIKHANGTLFVTQSAELFENLTIGKGG